MMKFCVIALILAASVLSSEAIINGVNIQTAPFMARIQYFVTGNQGESHGGGVIISHRHILTTGFILMDTFQVINIFVGGTTRGTQRPVTIANRIVRTDFTQSPRLNDIGIIVLNADLVFDRFVQPIALPPRGSVMPLDNEQATVFGFGGTPTVPSQNLEAAFMRVTNATRCGTRTPAPTHVQQFCAEDARLRSDFCAWDIGGPIVVQTRGEYILVGIASLHVCHVNTIQNPSQPSLFTRVSAFRQWIFDSIAI